MSLLPLGQPLVIKTVSALTTTGVILSIAEVAKAESAVFYFNRGVEKSNAGDYLRAISDYSKAIEINPNLPELYYNRGVAKAHLKDYSEAISDFSKVIEMIDPKDPRISDIYVSRGVSKSDSGDPLGGITDYNKAIEMIDPKDPRIAQVYVNRAKAKTLLKDYSGAISDINKGIEINPNYAVAYVLRGAINLELGNSKGVCSDWENASSLGNEIAAKLLKEQC